MSPLVMDGGMSDFTLHTIFEGIIAFLFFSKKELNVCILILANLHHSANTVSPSLQGLLLFREVRQKNTGKIVLVYLRDRLQEDRSCFLIP